MKKTTEIELVRFLSSLDKKHIDEFIDILTDFGKGRIALNSSVKEVLINEKKYGVFNYYSEDFIRLIITEFQLFAGNALVNQVRTELVSYEEILNDVYSYIVNKNTKEYGNKSKEKGIIDRLLGEKWLEMDFSKRFDKSLNIDTNQGGLSGINYFVGGVGKIVFRIDSSIKKAKALYHFSKESYRIIIPFIVQVSWLKLKYKFYEKENFPVQQEDFYSMNKMSKELNNEDISRLSQLFNLAPMLAVKNEILNNNIVMINIPIKDLQPVKDGEGLRAFVMGDNGIKEQAIIFEPDNLKKMINTGVLINLASTLVAQKHLADINEKLHEIKKSIDKIINILKNEYKAKIKAAYKEVNNILERIENYKEYNNERLNNIDLNSLANHLTNLQELYQFFIIELDKSVDNLLKLEKIEYKVIYEIIDNFNDCYNELKLCFNIKLAIYSIYFIITRDEWYKQKMRVLLSDTSDYLAGMKMKIDRAFESLIDKSKEVFNFDSTNFANLALVRNRMFDFEKINEITLEELEDFTMMFLENKTLSIEIRPENGEIKEASLLLTKVN